VMQEHVYLLDPYWGPSGVGMPIEAR
jgi:hypothetical protein